MIVLHINIQTHIRTFKHTHTHYPCLKHMRNRLHGGLSVYIVYPDFEPRSFSLMFKPSFWYILLRLYDRFKFTPTNRNRIVSVCGGHLILE